MRWHYTSVVRLRRILSSGVLLPHSCEDERAAVWFSSNQTWEQTACKRLSYMRRRLTFEEMVGVVGCARVGVERSDLLTFCDWWEKYLVPNEFAISIALGGMELGGHPGEWFASVEPVTRKDWRSVQVWKDGQWTNLEDTHGTER